MGLYVPSFVRWDCSNCGAIYNIGFEPTGFNGFRCYRCGAWVWRRIS